MHNDRGAVGRRPSPCARDGIATRAAGEVSPRAPRVARGGDARDAAFAALASRRYLLYTGPRVVFIIVFNGHELHVMNRNDRGRHVARASYIALRAS